MALGSKTGSNRDPKHQYPPRNHTRMRYAPFLPGQMPGTMTKSNTIQPSITEGRNLVTKSGGNSTLSLGRYECTSNTLKHSLASRCSGRRGTSSVSRYCHDGVADRPAGWYSAPIVRGRVSVCVDVFSHFVVDDSAFSVRDLPLLVALRLYATREGVAFGLM